MNWTKYNYLFEADEHCFLYNSLSNSFAELDRQTFDIVSKNKGNTERMLQELGEEELEKLKRMKAFVVSDAYELTKMRYVSLSRRFDSGSLLLTINPTLDCNFGCSYCFEKGQHHHLYMNDDVERDILAFIKKCKGIQKIRVTWFGGEPLMALPRIKSLTGKMKALAIDYSAGMISNGYLLTEKTAKELLNLSIKSVQVTLDGVARSHDKRRFLKNGGATYDRIVENLKRVHEKIPRLQISVRVNIDKSNEDDFLEIFNLFQEDPLLKGISINPAFVEDLSNGNLNDCLCNTQEQNAFLRRMFREHNLEFPYFYPSGGRMECAVRNPYAMVIGPEGELYKCWNDVGDKGKVYGHINGALTNEPLLLKYLTGSDPFEDERCKECILLPICSGGCPYLRIKRDEENPEISVCPLLKENLKDYLLFHYQNKKDND